MQKVYLKKNIVQYALTKKIFSNARKAGKMQKVT